jgi:hypothetical protein
LEEGQHKKNNTSHGGRRLDHEHDFSPYQRPRICFDYQELGVEQGALEFLIRPPDNLCRSRTRN